MNNLTELGILALLVLVLLGPHSAYGQESLPERVDRHEQEIIHLQDKISQLETVLKYLGGQSAVSSELSRKPEQVIYFVPIKNVSDCDLNKAEVSYADAQSSLPNIVQFPAALEVAPYEVHVSIYCS